MAYPHNCDTDSSDWYILHADKADCHDYRYHSCRVSSMCQILSYSDINFNVIHILWLYSQPYWIALSICNCFRLRFYRKLWFIVSGTIVFYQSQFNLNKIYFFHLNGNSVQIIRYNKTTSQKQSTFKLTVFWEIVTSDSYSNPANNLINNCPH